MRDILFRGKRTDADVWVEGFFTRDDLTNRAVILQGDRTDWGETVYNKYYIHENTIGQYIGLKDKRGNKIYEDDIVAIDLTVLGSDEENRYGKVFWDNEASRFSITISDRFIDFDNCRCYYDIEVVGNIHDDPNLIGGEAE